MSSSFLLACPWLDSSLSETKTADFEVNEHKAKTNANANHVMEPAPDRLFPHAAPIYWSKELKIERRKQVIWSEAHQTSVLTSVAEDTQNISFPIMVVKH